MFEFLLPFDDAEDDPSEEIQHLHQLIKAQNDRRRHLEVQAALAGRSASPEIATEIRDIRANITRLRVRIKQLRTQRTIAAVPNALQYQEGTPAILVLEEQLPLTTLLQDVLDTLSTVVEVVPLGNPLKAIIATQQRPVPLVIAEHPFHAESALEFCLTIQRISPRTDVALVLQAIEHNVTKHAHASGMDVLFAPITQRDLVPILAYVLNRRRK